MKFTLKDLTGHPNKLAIHYTRFRVGDRLLLTGHSHQAWPDVAYEGMESAWRDAADLVDNKWERAMEMADEVRRGFSRLLDDENGYIALGSNTHELIIRLLSALPLHEKPKLITTDGEFHTIRRQFSRLVEEGIEVVRVPSSPVNEVADRIISQLDDQTAAVFVSSVFFDSGLINPGIKTIAEACRMKGVELLVDAYHSLNVAPFSVKEMGLQHAFVTGGGYKYCQLGEGNCFLRFPKGFSGRPVVTGWFSEFSLLAKKQTGRIEYGQGPDLFAGSTYDPVSHYRAARVFRFFEEMGLTPGFLREVNQHQTTTLIKAFDDLKLPETLIHPDRMVENSQRAGFVVFKTDRAAEIHRGLAQSGVLTDYRGTSLRFGPAPYLSDRQLYQSIEILGKVARNLK